MSSSTVGVSEPNPSLSTSASAIVAEPLRASHVLRIDGYAHTKAIPTGKRLESAPFTAFGHIWCIHYYPNGHTEASANYISLFLALKSSVDDPFEVRYDIRFAEEDEKPLLASARYKSYGDGYGYAKFIRRSVLERSYSRYLRDDAFTIRCDMSVVNFRSDMVSTASVPVPPSDLHQHLRDLLETRQGADVVFEVGGETLAAHRWMLAVRSPVFNAELFGQMQESSTGVVRVDDMEAEVFKALLCFIYTDMLPEMSGEEEFVMSQHMLVASDKYSLDRLKCICEDNLSKRIEEGNVMFLLELAEQHRCHGLKDACFEFLCTPAHLEAALATDSFKHLSRNCPSIMMELIAKLGTYIQ
ncbi:hypothetical protein HU200_007513 [Digitaria exilis]|uniref:Uncharacterized protein n=1 Tax=Digitaria exilis TaxID=1010633 RepID=A0A835KQY3_9POAL|nr:hypothetical protein HU200_007513 [Digitaria exilis]